MQLIAYLKDRYTELYKRTICMIWKIAPGVPVPLTMLLNYWDDVFPIGYSVDGPVHLALGLPGSYWFKHKLFYLLVAGDGLLQMQYA